MAHSETVRRPACNYDPVATDDDGTCEYETCAGCLDGGVAEGIPACNYDPEALIDDGSMRLQLRQGCTNPCAGQLRSR